jgi:uncharacterized membrane protein YeaQ/YmgE (transglycosylase-associated protein family)
MHVRSSGKAGFAMTIFEPLSWLVLGGVLGVVVAAFWRTPGLTWTRALEVGMFGAVLGGLIGRILFLPGPSSGEMQVVSPALLVAAIGAVVGVFIVRSEIRNRERPHLT